MKTDGKADKRIKAYYMGAGILFMFFFLTGHKLAKEGNILWTAGYTLLTLVLSMAVGALLGYGAWWCTGRLLVMGKNKGQEPAPLSKGKRGLLFGGSFALIAASWLPAYLAYYPAICAYDFPVQMEQIFRGEYIDHHPIAHTLLLKWFMELGERAFGDVNTGIAWLAALQALSLAAVFAYGLLLLRHLGAGKVWLIGWQIFAMCYPFHWYMSISMTKDVFFTLFFLLQLYGLMLLLWQKKNTLRAGGADVLFGLATVGMILFRNNGRYACMVLLVILLLMVFFGKKARKLWGRISLVAFASFAVGNLALSGLFAATDATQGDKREMLSVPAQQLARCMLYHGGVNLYPEDDGTMLPEDVEMIEAFLVDRGYSYYQADFADPVKRHVKTSAALQNAGQFVKTYLRLMVQYPGDYINAVLALDAGYLYPEDVSHAYVNQVDYAPGKGYAQTRWAEEELLEKGFYKDSKWEWLHVKMEDWAERNAHLSIPVIKYLFVPGVWIWAYLWLGGVRMQQKKYGYLLPLALILGYYITILLGPVVQLRYLYPVMVAFPILAAPVSGKREVNEQGETA